MLGDKLEGVILQDRRRKTLIPGNADRREDALRRRSREQLLETSARRRVASWRRGAHEGKNGGLPVELVTTCPRRLIRDHSLPVHLERVFVASRLELERR